LEETRGDSSPPENSNGASEVGRDTGSNRIALAFFSLAMSVVFLDYLPAKTLLVGGLAPSVVGVVLGALLSYWCLY
jgi:hypothetical protein